MQLHPQVKDRLDDIEKHRRSRTHEVGDPHHRQEGPLDNPADRDHCIQYMVAVPLIYGRPHRRRLRGQRRARSAHRRAARQDDLRRGQAVLERLPRPGEALDRQRDHRSEFKDGKQARRSRRRVSDRPHAAGARKACPLLVEKFRTNLARCFPEKQQAAILDVALDAKRARSDAGARVRRPDGDLTARLSSSPNRDSNAQSAVLVVPGGRRRGARAAAEELSQA